MANWKDKDWKATAKEKEEKLSQLIHEIGKNYSTNPEQIAEMMAFASKFYHYSLRNMSLIRNQNAGATYVQSFAAWKSMGAHIKKGEHGCQILVPVTITYLIVSDNEYVQLAYATEEQKMKYSAGLIESRSKLAYKIGTVFDIAQTDFPKERYPELYSMGYESSQHKAICDGLIQYCDSIHCPVTSKNVESIALRGYYSHNNFIVLNELLNDTQRLSTLTHEMGHMLCDHAKREVSKVQKEFEADCVSIIMQAHYGMELTDTRKEHLAEHYKKYLNEIKKENPTLTEDQLIKKMDGVLGSALKIFKDNVEVIDRFVNREIESHIYEDFEENKDEEPVISYEVVECSEYPLMGDVFTEIENVQEAFITYNSIDESRRTMIPGINLRVSNPYDESYVSIPLICGKNMNLTNIDLYAETFQHTEVAREIKNAVDYVRNNTNYQISGEDTLEKLIVSDISLEEPRREENLTYNVGGR